MNDAKGSGPGVAAVAVAVALVFFMAYTAREVSRHPPAVANTPEPPAASPVDEDVSAGAVSGTASASVATSPTTDPVPELQYEAPPPESPAMVHSLASSAVPLAPSTRLASRASTPSPRPRDDNRPPRLQGGGTRDQTQGKLVRLVAEGTDPDGDRVTYEWDFGNCLRSTGSDMVAAEVALKDGCNLGAAVLVWTDEVGATAALEWTLTR